MSAAEPLFVNGQLLYSFSIFVITHDMEVFILIAFPLMDLTGSGGVKIPWGQEGGFSPSISSQARCGVRGCYCVSGKKKV